MRSLFSSRRVALATVLVISATAASAHRCTGDCDGSDTVAIDELVTGVRIALDQLPLDTCYAFDPDLDGRVSINELQVAVNNVFSFCGHDEPPTPVPTRTLTLTLTAAAGTPTATPTATRTPITGRVGPRL